MRGVVRGSRAVPGRGWVMGDKQRPFAVAISANRPAAGGTAVTMAAGFCMARSSAEAQGMALNMARETWPVADGYSQHGASWMEISKEHSDLAASAFRSPRKNEGRRGTEG